MDEAGHLLEDSWFFGNLLHTKTKTVSRSYSDLASSSCLPPHPYPPLSSNQESIVKNERKSSSFSLRNQPPVAPPTLTRTPSLPTSIETQSFAMIDPKPNHSLISFGVGSDQEDAIVKNEWESSRLSSRTVAPPSLIRTPSLPTSAETQSFLMKNPNQIHELTRKSSIVGSDQENTIQKKSPSLKQPPIASPSLTRRPSLPNSIKTQSFLTRNRNPSPNLTQSSSMSTPVSGSDHEDEDDDEESEFTLGRLIRQASIKLSHTSNPTQQTSKAMTDNLRKKPEEDQEKISDLGKLERNRRKITKNSGKKKYDGGAPEIPGGLMVDKSSSEDMKAHIKFWARAVASNVRQECS